MADQLSQDQASVWLETEEMKIQSLRRKDKLAAEARDLAKRAAEPSGGAENWFKKNTRPIISDPAPPPPVSSRLTPQARRRLHSFLEEAKENKTRDQDPFTILLHPQPFQTYLPTLTANLGLEAFDAEKSDENAACSITDISVIWNTGFHHTIITDDLLPQSFLDYLGQPGYSAYRLGSDTAIRIQISVKFSNCNHVLEAVAMIRPAGSLPNGFSGVIAGEHSLLDSIEYQVVPARVLRSRGVQVDGYWGEIRLLGTVVVGKYETLE